MPWFEETACGIVIHIKAQPKASKTQVSGLHGDRIKIRLAAPPVDGKANEELLRFLKETLAATSSQLKIIRGEKSPLKDILCVGIPVENVHALAEDDRQLQFWPLR